MQPTLVRPLFEGPIDIIGDVHGEIEALQNLLVRLGYTDRGDHPEGRRVVFLGDLTDRGPDSPSVVELVRALVSSGRAQCVLGNHDLNILLGHKKFDNWWFFGREYAQEGSPRPQRVADDAVRESVRSFFAELPLVLERPGVRVVHACWHEEMVRLVRDANDSVALYEQYQATIESECDANATLDDIDRGLQLQIRNPVKVLTSGLERRVSPPFFASGKWRHEERVPWWDQYAETALCVFGHYSKPYCHGAAICMDYGVAKRWNERLAENYNGWFESKLAALRLPENTVVFDAD
jgi:hypothetical protein